MMNDRPDFFQQGVNTLEKLTHQYHMHEIYAAAAPIYKKLKEQPPSDAELCSCVNDITGNGILVEMANIARQLKYFQSKRIPRGGRGCERKDRYGFLGIKGVNKYGCNRKKRSADEGGIERISALEKEYFANPTVATADRLLHARPWKGNTLVGPEQWVSYEAMLTSSMLESEELNDFATFMYCRLNQPDTDHPQGLFDRAK